MRIAVDFDGTIVEHEFPEIGRPVPGAIDWMQRWQLAGAELILWTMRSDGQAFGPVLQQAVDYCSSNGVQFDAVNCGIGDEAWTASRKVYANIYVDDAAFGCPIIESKRMGGRPMVDWSVVGPAVLEMIEAEA